MDLPEVWESWAPGKRGKHGNEEEEPFSRKRKFADGQEFRRKESRLLWLQGVEARTWAREACAWVGSDWALCLKSLDEEVRFDSGERMEANWLVRKD